MYVDRMQKKKKNTHTHTHCNIVGSSQYGISRRIDISIKYDPFRRGGNVLCDTRETPIDRNNTRIYGKRVARGNREYEEISICMDFRG